MEPEGSSPHSQAPATCPYRQPERSSPCLHIPFIENQFYYCPPIYMQFFHVVSFHLVSSLLRPCETFCNIVTFYGKELLASRPTCKLDETRFSAVHVYLFRIPSISGGRSSARNIRTRHDVVTVTHLSRKI